MRCNKWRQTISNSTSQDTYILSQIFDVIQLQKQVHKNNKDNILILPVKSPNTEATITSRVYVLQNGVNIMATPAINIDTLFNIRLLTHDTPANPPEIILPTVLVIPVRKRKLKLNDVLYFFWLNGIIYFSDKPKLHPI